MNTEFYSIIERRLINDHRGFFLKTMTGFEPDLSDSFGEIYVIKGDKGKARANHYHCAATEWFTILQGKVMLNLKHVVSGDTTSLLLTDEAPVTVRVNPKVAHSLIGVEGQSYLLMAYTDVRFNPIDTIAYPTVNISESPVLSKLPVNFP
jgi:dTDP-4-dehydrorhamnose 3,5-epimerase-like enzyme